MQPIHDHSNAHLSIEVCETLDQIRECMDLQRAIWSDTDEDVTPSAIFLVANKTGGHVLLARDETRAVGFALAFAGFHGDLRYLHSHIVGVVPAYQNRGVGRLLKLKQREIALDRQIGLMEWTFDPLASRNAFFAIVRLGAVVRSFLPNFYGITPSPLHGGIPTDRLVAEWWLASPRVQTALSGRAPVPQSGAVQIALPAEIEDWKTSGSPRMEEVQTRLRTEFQERFAKGYAVTGFRTEGRSGTYLLERYESQESHSS